MPIVKVEGLGALGVNTDTAPYDLPPNAISRVENMRFRDGYAERFAGLGQANPLAVPAAAAYWLQPYSTVAARYWIHATLGNIYADDGTTKININGAAPPTASVDDRYTGGVLSGVLVVNNGVDIPQFWGGAGVLADLPGWASNWRAKSLRPFKNFLVGVGISKSSVEYPHMVKWSAAAVPGSVPSSWDEANPAIDAGELDLAETQDLCVDQLPLGDVNIVYKDQSMWSMRYIGAPQIFEFQRLPGDEVGLAARGCVVSTPVGHVLLTYGDVVVHSGQGPRSILNARMRRWLGVRMSTVYFKRSFLAVNRRANEVWVCFPQAGSDACTLALVWNWVGDTFGVRDLPGITYGASGRMPVGGTAETWATSAGSWASSFGAWDEEENNASETRLLLARRATPALLLADEGNDNDGTAFQAVLERVGLTFDAPETVKTCRGMFLRIDGPANAVLSVEIGASMSAEQSPIYSAAVPYTIGSSYKVDSFATGRFLSYRVTGAGSFPWRIAAVDLDIIPRGQPGSASY